MRTKIILFVILLWIFYAGVIWYEVTHPEEPIKLKRDMIIISPRIDSISSHSIYKPESFGGSYWTKSKINLN